MRGPRRILAAALAAGGLLAASAAAWAEPAAAHGLVGRADLPVPESYFAWAVRIVLVLSFIALAVLWKHPLLERDSWRPVARGLGRVLTSRPVEIACGAIGVFLLGVVVFAGLEGTATPTGNFAPTFVYVVFYVGLVAVSALIGDVFRAFNPWRAAARGVAWIATKAAGEAFEAPRAYPEWLGRWPAAAGLVAFGWMELAAANGDVPQSIAIATIIYSGLTWAAMAIYGVEPWATRGEAFSVYFNLFSRISPFERRDREIGVRIPLSGLAKLEQLPGTVAVLAVMIGTVSFDGLAEAPLWADITPHLTDFFGSLGFSPERSVEGSFGLGLIVMIVLVYCFYRLAALGMRWLAGSADAGRLERVFVHSLVPIALAYVAAHYLTLLLYQGQSIFFLISDPLGDGADLFGTAGRSIDYGVIGANATWYWQVGFVLVGHVAALALAHDRAVTIYGDSKLATRSQYWMLAVMIGFTTLALLLLSTANA
ncbi:MAG: hypothetical protein WD649_06405 [Thermoleophilaceae bacterium]